MFYKAVIYKCVHILFNHFKSYINSQYFINGLFFHSINQVRDLDFIVSADLLFNAYINTQVMEKIPMFICVH
jgi:hypothetical protein